MILFILFCFVVQPSTTSTPIVTTLTRDPVMFRFMSMEKVQNNTYEFMHVNVEMFTFSDAQSTSPEDTATTTVPTPALAQFMSKDKT